MERWIIHLIAGLDEHINEKTRTKVLEQCGRQCQSRGFVRKAQGNYQKSKNIDAFLDEFGKVHTHLHRDGNKVHIIYPKCYGPHVNKIPPRKLSATYCN